jgi:hypothetical protein
LLRQRKTTPGFKKWIEESRRRGKTGEEEETRSSRKSLK